MSSYPQNPRFEEWIHGDKDCDGVGVYVTHDGYLLVVAPYMDSACFSPKTAEKVCEVIMRASQLAMAGVG